VKTEDLLTDADAEDDNYQLWWWLTFMTSSRDCVNASSASIILNSDKWCRVWEFSARNVGPKVYTFGKALQPYI